MARQMEVGEKTIRQSIEALQKSINELCKQRDALAAMLPDAPREPMKKISPITGKPRSMVMGGGKRGRKNVA